MQRRVEQKAEELLLGNYEKYYRLAYTYVKSEEDALDVVQESAYKVMKECRKVKEEAFLETWIYRIVINTAHDILRRRAPVVPMEPEMEEWLAPQEDHYQDLDLQEALAMLDQNEKSVILLRYFEDRKLEEIARITDVGVSTVKSRLYRALKKLKITLADI